MILKRPIPFLAFNGGYVDTLGFLSFNGLFTAHVTGNFVTLGAALAYGYSGVITKLLALPVFCLVIIISHLSGRALVSAGKNDLRILLLSEVILMCLTAGIVYSFGPFSDGDSPAAMTSGLALVAAMAIQNAIHRSHLTNEAPSTLMTGTTTQIMLDVVDLVAEKTNETRKSLRTRLKKLGGSLLFFTLGCTMAAIAFIFFRKWGFMLPPVVAFLSWITIENSTGSQKRP